MSLADAMGRPILHRALFFGVTVLPLLLIAAIALPIRDELAAGEAGIARQAAMLARLKGIAVYRPEPGADAAKATPTNEYATAANEGIASAQLQQRLKGFAQGSGTRLRLIQGLPARNEGPLRLIGARLDIDGPIKAVHRAVHAIETARPYLLIRSATIRLSRQPRTLRGRSTPPVIEAQLEVFAAFKQEAGQ